MSEFTHLLNGATVKFHGYRSAKLMDHSLAIPRDTVRKFEEELYGLTNTSPSNHVIFEITTSDGGDDRLPVLRLLHVRRNNCGG